MGDVGRVGDDQVVDLAVEVLEQVRVHQAHVGSFQPRDVLARQGQRVLAQVRRVHLPVRVVVRRRDGDAARAGAHVERAVDLAAAEPGFEARLDQFGDRRTRHQGARVGLEAQAGEPGLAGEVTGRNTFVDAAREQRQHFLLLVGGQARLAVGRAQVVRQVQGMQDQLGRFVQGVVVAVPEAQAGGAEAARPVADEVDDGLKLGRHVLEIPCDGASIAAPRL